MVGALATVGGVILLAVAGAAAACGLRVRGRAALVAATLIIAAASVVLATIALSLIDALTRGGLLVAEAVIAAAALAGWVANGRPRPAESWRTTRSAAWSAVRAHPVLACFALIAALALVIQLAVGIAVAPNNWDSMTYHLSRSAYWLQQDSATRFSGGSVRQLGLGPNAEILDAWTMAMTGADRFVAAVQWLALIGVVCAAFLGARVIGFGRPGALLAAALFAMLPEAILQSTTTQNDLITSFFVLATGVFGVRGLRDRHRGDLVVAALAAGLAIGTKGTAFALAPSLAILLGAAVWRYRPPRPLVLFGIASLVVATVAVGAWGYALNLDAGDPVFGGLTEKTQRESAVPQNEVRVLWTFVDSPGSPVPWFNTFATKLAHKTLGHLEIPNRFSFGVDDAVSEDTSAYGLVGWFLLFPLLLVLAFAPRPGPHREWAIAALVGLIAFPIAFEFNIWVGRLLLPTVALAAPLFAAIAARPGLAATAMAAAVVSLVPSVIVNQNKPLLVPEGQPKITQLSRIQQMALLRPEMAPVITAVDQRIGASGALAFVGDEDSWDYPFFGEHRERRVVRFSSLREATPGAIRAARVRGVLFANVGRPGRAFRARQIGPDYWFAAIG
jgi:dolichyl-phosphate-mannose-protein mannosyltransferase